MMPSCDIEKEDPLKDEARKQHLREMTNTKKAMELARENGYYTEYKGLKKKMDFLSRQLYAYDCVKGYRERK